MAAEPKPWTTNPAAYVPGELDTIWISFCLRVILLITESILARLQIISASVQWSLLQHAKALGSRANVL